MRAILFGMAVTVLIWFALIVVHDYGQYKYKAAGMKKCSCDTAAILEKERTKNDILKSKSRRR